MRFEDFFDNKDGVAVNCRTVGEAKILMMLFENSSNKWYSGSFYSPDKTNWMNEGTCYSNEHTYGYIDGYRRKGFDILSFEDFLGTYFKDSLFNIKDLYTRGLINKDEYIRLFTITMNNCDKYKPYDRFDFNEFFSDSKKIAVNCKTSDEAVNLHLLFECAGQFWNNDEFYSHIKTHWSSERTCYANNRCYGNIEYFTEGQVISYYDFLKKYYLDVLHQLYIHKSNIEEKYLLDILDDTIDTFEE